MHWWQQLKNIYHFGQAYFWRMWFGWPDRTMHFYGVTGTNGKTTTTHVLASILREEYGKANVGLLSTIAFWFGEREMVNATKMTSTDARVVFRYLREMRKAGVRQVVIELTSHALDQYRLAGLHLQGAIVTNLAREHLDYHHTMQEYAQAKQRIIDYLVPGAPFVGKGDDSWVAKMLDVAKSRGYSVQPFTALGAQEVITPLPGEVNKENVLAATLLARAVGSKEESIRRGVAAVDHMPGRMEKITSPTGFSVIIDYAVTPDALDYLYRFVKRTAQGQVFGVLGACGRRDRGKRPDMARTVAQYVNELVLTREDPWTEPEEQIFGDLERGLEGFSRWQRITDRREAIRYFVRKAQSGDVIVITGKGAEVGMAIGEKVVPWNDREVIENLLHERKAKN